MNWVTLVSRRPIILPAVLSLLALGGCASVDAPADCQSCAVSSGEFQLENYAVATAGNWYAADFDGDGVDELLVARASGPTSIFRFEGRELIESTELPVATWACIGDVTGDSRPDVLLGGGSFSVQRGTASGAFEALSGQDTPVSGEMTGAVSVTKFPIVGSFHKAHTREPLIVKDLYHLEDRSLLPTQVESFASDKEDVSAGGNAELRTLLKLSKRFAALDLDGDGVDELWGVDLLGHLTQLRLRGRAGWVAAGSWSVEDPRELSVRDVDGDGIEDLVGQRTALVVTGGSALRAGRVHHLALPEAAESCVWLQLDRDKERELLCQGERGLRAYDADLGADTLAPIEPPAVAASDRFVVGDFDGNGVEDLVGLGRRLDVAFGLAAR